MRRLLYWLFSSLCLLLLVACEEERPELALVDSPELRAGDPERGTELIEAYGCTACHTIPGIPNANTLVGPPLTSWARRQYIAGRVPNTPRNLILWLQDPQAIEPGTVMPDMGVDERDARDMAAYLFTLAD